MNKPEITVRQKAVAKKKNILYVSNQTQMLGQHFVNFSI